MINLSEYEAYVAMFSFLERRYRITKSDDLGSLLGDMSLLPDGSTADAAIWGEWLNSVTNAKAGDVAVNMELD